MGAPIRNLSQISCPFTPAAGGAVEGERPGRWDEKQSGLAQTRGQYNLSNFSMPGVRVVVPLASDDVQVWCRRHGYDGIAAADVKAAIGPPRTKASFLWVHNTA